MTTTWERADCVCCKRAGAAFIVGNTKHPMGHNSTTTEQVKCDECRASCRRGTRLSCKIVPVT